MLIWIFQGLTLGGIYTYMTSNFIFKKYHTVKETMASLVAQIVKNLPAMQETWVKSLDQGDLLEKEMATHSWILAWRIPWTEEPYGLQSVGWQRVRHNRLTNTLSMNMKICINSCNSQVLWIWRHELIHAIPMKIDTQYSSIPTKTPEPLPQS